MSPPLDELYLTWLYGQVADPEEKRPGRTYWHLMREFYKTEFVWIVPHDDNRCQDGKDLREEFARDMRITIHDDGWLCLGCSMLELFVSLSRRLAFEGEGEPSRWFWEMMHNIGLDAEVDSAKNPRMDISQILFKIIWRKYEADGQGGLFPLREPRENQRFVELWYQMQAYLIENC